MPAWSDQTRTRRRFAIVGFASAGKANSGTDHPKRGSAASFICGNLTRHCFEAGSRGKWREVLPVLLSDRYWSVECSSRGLSYEIVNTHVVSLYSDGSCERQANDQVRYSGRQKVGPNRRGYLPGSHLDQDQSRTTPRSRVGTRAWQHTGQRSNKRERVRGGGVRNHK